MALTRDEVRKVALLARLELKDSELDRQAGHINELLDQFEKLKQVDVNGIEPTSHSIPLLNVLREDLAKRSLARDEAIANAPESRDGCFVVPRIIDS